MKNKRYFLVLLIMCFIFRNGYVFAEDKEEKDYEVYTLGEIVVTGSGSAVRDVGITSEVTFEDIKKTNSKTVAEALKFVPGVEITIARKNEANISVQGFNQSKAVVLIDGVPYYETKYGKLDLNQIGTDGVARIDVIKGAASVLYGANAEAGVINIITKKPTETPSFSANIEIGAKDAKTVSLSHGMKKGILNYWLGYTHRDYDAWPLSNDFVPRQGTVTVRDFSTWPPTTTTTDTYIENGGNYRDNSDYRTDNIWAKIGLEPSDGAEYYLNMHYISTEKGDPPNIDEIMIMPAPPAFSWFDRMSNYTDWGLDFSAKKAVTDKLTLQGTFFYHDHADEYLSFADASYQTLLADSEYKDYILGGMLLAGYSVADWDTMKMSVHYRGDSHKQRDDDYLPFENNYAYTGSVGFENEMSLINDRMSLVMGISYDWFEIDDATSNDTDNSGAFIEQIKETLPAKQDDINPMIGVTYSLDGARLFASIAKKTRFPTLSELFGRGGDINLEAETSINYTIGINKSFYDFLAFEVATFYHDISDRISRDVPTPDGNYKNIAEISMIGAEINAAWTPAEELSFKMGYTYLHAEDNSPGSVTDRVTDVPSHKINFMMDFIFPVTGSRFNLNMVYFSESIGELPTSSYPNDPVVKNESYTVFNGKISHKFSESHEVYIRGENIFDKRYEYRTGYPAPGASVWLGVIYNLK